MNKVYIENEARRNVRLKAEQERQKKEQLERYLSMRQAGLEQLAG